MAGNFLRDLVDALFRPDEKGSGYDARLLPRFGWECECGAHSRRPGFLDEYSARGAAENHRLRSEVGHATPRIVREDPPGL